MMPSESQITRVKDEPWGNHMEATMRGEGQKWYEDNVKERNEQCSEKENIEGSIRLQRGRKINTVGKEITQFNKLQIN